MNKLQHLKLCKQFLRKVVTYRRTLFRYDRGRKATKTMVATMASIGFLLPTIVSFDQMMNYLGQKCNQYAIKQLIPPNKTAWCEELDYLLARGEYLEQPTLPRKLTFSY